MNSRFVPACALLVAALSLRADTVVFKNGDELSGDVVEKNDKALTLAVEFGTLQIPMERVLRIDKETSEQAAERKKKKEAADAEAARMKAEGMVRYKGEWVTEEEKKAEEAKVAAERKAKKAEEEAKKKVAEATAKAEKLARQAQALADAANNTNDRNNRFNRNHSRTDTYDNQYGNGYNGGINNGYYGGSTQNYGRRY